jgi:hypothetical protein
MKFYVVEDGQFVEKDGYCVLGKFHAIKLGKGNWVVYDSKSGLQVVDGLKTITACAAWVKSADGVAAISTVRGRADYASLTAAMKEYRHAHKLVAPDKYDEVVKAEVVDAPTESPTESEASSIVEAETSPVK